MSRWNETCAITNLPIRKDDPITAIFLKKIKPKTDNCIYPDNHWVPIGFPISGKYGGDGTIVEIAMHPWNKLLLPVDDATMIRTTTKDNHLMLIHQEIYRQIIDYLGHRCFKGKPYRDILYDQMVQFFQNERPPQFMINLKNPFRFGANADVSMFRMILDRYEQCTDEKLRKEAIQASIDSQILYKALLLLRKGYYTISGAGSICSETALHVLVARYTIEHAQTMFFKENPNRFLENGYEEPCWFSE